MAVNKLLIPKEYPHPRRLPIGQLPECKKNTIMPIGHVKELLSQKVIIEEKMDGHTTCFTVDKGRFSIFCEDLKWMHSIYYKIPARYAVFDIFDNRRTLFLDCDEKTSVFRSMRDGAIAVTETNSSNFFKVDTIAYGTFALEALPSLMDISRYAFDKKTGLYVRMEGIVVKPARSLFFAEMAHYAAKLVRTEFLEGITNNYLKKSRVQNEINPKYSVE